MHSFGGSADTVLKTDAFHFSHSSDFGGGSTSDHFASRAVHEPVQIVVDNLDDMESTVEVVSDDEIMTDQPFSTVFQPVIDASPFNLVVQ